MHAIPTPPRLQLGQVLVGAGHLSGDQLRIALREQRSKGELLGRHLINLGFVSEDMLYRALGQALAVECVDLEQAIADPSALAMLNEGDARRLRALPLSYDAHCEQLTLATSQPQDIVVLDRIRERLPNSLRLRLRIAGDAELERAIDRHYGHALAIDDILGEIEEDHAGTRLARRQQDAREAPIVRLVNAFLTDAVKRRASDVHFEPEAGFLRIRYRIDGVLHLVRVLHALFWPAMTVRLKVLAGMNIAETRAPQDGRFSLAIAGRTIDFRAAAQPTLHGENLVLRILDRAKGIVPLAQLGLGADHSRELERMLARPEGIILVTGPTGSGKTTTLYAILNQLNKESVHIMTLEDPVEYPLPRIRQTSLSDSSKLDFASGIRSMMRQDPDIILIGEIRDGETAEMAFRAALTGHQVFATLHSNSALGALPRLRDIGIGADILAGNIAGIVAQRLARRLCPHCRIERQPSAAECRVLGLPTDAEPPPIFDAKGCPHCDFHGYQGRLPLLEILRVDRELDELIASKAPLSKLREHSLNRHFVSLADDGIRHVLAGNTSLSEVRRVVDLSERL